MGRVSLCCTPAFAADANAKAAAAAADRKFSNSMALGRNFSQPKTGSEERLMGMRREVERGLQDLETKTLFLRRLFLCVACCGLASSEWSNSVLGGGDIFWGGDRCGHHHLGEKGPWKRPRRRMTISSPPRGAGMPPSSIMRSETIRKISSPVVIVPVPEV